MNEILEFEENLHAIAHPTVELTGNRKTLVFAASVAQAERLAEIINRHKPDSARFVCGETPKDIRRRMFSEYAEKKFQYLINVSVATEGFDDPDIEVVVMARPTKSRCLYSQMTGRGLRPAGVLGYALNDMADADARKAAIAASFKPSCEIIDFVGNSGRHKLIHAADVLGGKFSDEVVDRAIKNSEKSGKPGDVMTELQKAEQEIHKEHAQKGEASRRDRIKILAQYSTAKVNPFDVLDINPVREAAWHKGRPASQKQIDALTRFGIDPAGPVNGYLSFVHASQLLDRMINRAKEHKCTFKQANVLRRYGYDTDEMSFDDARIAMDTLARNGWKRPKKMA